MTIANSAGIDQRRHPRGAPSAPVQTAAVTHHDEEGSRLPFAIGRDPGPSNASTLCSMMFEQMFEQMFELRAEGSRS